MISLSIWLLPVLIGSIGLIISIKAKNGADAERRRLEEEKQKLEKEIKHLEEQEEQRRLSVIAWNEKKDDAVKAHKYFLEARNLELGFLENQEREISRAEKKKCPICKRKKRDCVCPKTVATPTTTNGPNQH